MACSNLTRDAGVVALTRPGARTALGNSARDQTGDGCEVYGFVGVAAGGVRSGGEAVSAGWHPHRAHRSGREIDVLLSDVSTLNYGETVQPASETRRWEKSESELPLLASVPEFGFDLSLDGCGQTW